MSDNRMEHGKLQQQYFQAQYEEKARNISNWGKTGTSKKRRIKTDWSSLIAAMVIIALVIIVIRVL